MKNLKKFNNMVRLKQSWQKKRRPCMAAFTLVELLVVIVVIAILASITIGVSNYAGWRARDARSKIARAKIEMALEEYRAYYGEYPIKSDPNHYPTNWVPDPDTSENLPLRFRCVNLVDGTGDTNLINICQDGVEELPFNSALAGGTVRVNHLLTYPLCVRPKKEGRAPFLECEKVTVCYLVWRHATISRLDGEKLWNKYVGTNFYYLDSEHQSAPLARMFIRGDPVNRFVAVNPNTGKQWVYNCTDGTTYTLTGD